MKQLERLILNWDFAEVTGSDGSGQFIANDFSGNDYQAIGNFFSASQENVVSKEHLYSEKQELPFELSGIDTVNILDQDDVSNGKYSRPVDYMFAFEKSMYNTISEEMINWFDTVNDFNNIVGEPINKYRQSYHQLNNLRELFFKNVQNVPDVEKYLNYYKWFDESLTFILNQFVPASALFSDQVNNVIESHIFEKNKVFNKFPLLTNKQQDPEGVIEDIYAVETVYTDHLSGTFVFAKDKIPEYYQTEATPFMDVFPDDQSIVRIRNVQGKNFNKDYEVVQGSGDDTWFTNHLDEISLTPENPLNTPNIDYLLPTRPKNEWRFQELFSAPGGFEVNSRGFLDPEHEEKSAYNALPWRNLRVKEEQIRQLLDHSLSSSHKTSENAYFDGNDWVYDNGYKTSMIPASEYGYTWITSSVSGSKKFYQYAPVSGEVSSSNGYESAYNLMESASSTIGDMYFGDYNYWILNPTVYGYLTNLNFSCEVNEATNTLEYYNTVPEEVRDLTMRNAYLSRNGPYGWSTFNQMRSGNHKVNRYFRSKNILSSEYLKPGTGYVYRNVFESPISSRNHPLKLTLRTKDEPNIDLEVLTSYGNNLSSFGSRDTNGVRTEDFLGTGKNGLSNPQVYEQLKKFYIEKDIPEGDNPVSEFKSITLKETVYPKEENTNFTNDRPSYAETQAEIDELSHRTFWRKNIEDRRRTYGTALNSQGEVILDNRMSSIWPMDHKNRLNNLDTIISGDYNTGELMSKMLTHGVVSSGNKYLPVTAALQYVRSSTIGLPLYFSYDIPEMSGKNPWFDSYEDYSLDLKKLGWDSSVLPEFRASERMEDYLNYGFLQQQDDFLTLDGGIYSSSAESRLLGFDAPFFKTYSNSDFMKYFKTIHSDHSIIDGLEYQLSLTCDGIKKLLPYNGFYPQTRTLQLGTLFSESLSDHVTLSAKAPATLKVKISNFNTLPDNGGSTITLSGSLEYSFDAVDTVTSPTTEFDVGTANSDCAQNLAYAINNYTNNEFLAYSFYISGTGPLEIYHIIINASPYGSAANSYTIKTSGSSGDTSQWCTLDWNTDICNANNVNDNFINGSDNSSINKTFMTFLYPFMSPGVLFNSIKSGIAVDFPIITGSLSLLVNYDSGYYSEITSFPNYRISFNELYDLSKSNLKNSSLVHMEPLYTEFLSASAVWDGNKDQNYELAMHNFLSEVVRFFHESKNLTTLTSDREQKFLVATSGSKYYMDIFLNKEDLIMHQTQIGYPVEEYGPGYQVFSLGAGDPHSTFPNTPPYYYGKSKARVAFEPADGTRQYTLKEIFANSTVEYFNDGWNNYLETYPEVINYPAYQESMQISASINLFGIANAKLAEYKINGNDIQNNGAIDTYVQGINDVWIISPHCEFPVLNCVTASDVLEIGIENSPSGMWHQYGTFPTGSQGIWFGLEESFSIDEMDDPVLTGSLIDLCGFKNPGPVRIGEIAEYKQISEAVVAVPYTYTGNVRQFVKIDQDVVTEAIRSLDGGNLPSTSVEQQIQKMRKFLIPPQLDFLKNTSLDPIVMYIFEFTHVLSKQDLADIWQGVMPEISLHAEKQSVTVSHKFGDNEFFKPGEDLSNIQWMVFKAKQKAEWNYYKVTADSTDDARFEEQFNIGGEGGIDKLHYSYNWPYDFFSLVELAKVSAEVEWRPEVEHKNGKKKLFIAEAETPSLNEEVIQVGSEIIEEVITAPTDQALVAEQQQILEDVVEPTIITEVEQSSDPVTAIEGLLGGVEFVPIVESAEPKDREEAGNVLIKEDIVPDNPAVVISVAQPPNLFNPNLPMQEPEDKHEQPVVVNKKKGNS